MSEIELERIEQGQEVSSVTIGASSSIFVNEAFCGYNSIVINE